MTMTLLTGTTMTPVEAVFRATLASFAGEPPDGRPEDWQQQSIEYLANRYGSDKVLEVLNRTRCFVDTDPRVSRLLFLSAFGNRVEIVMALAAAAMEASTP